MVTKMTRLISTEKVGWSTTFRVVSCCESMYFKELKINFKKIV